LGKLAKSLVSLREKVELMSAKYVVKETADGRYRFNLLTENNENILTSTHLYKIKIEALIGIEKLKVNCRMDRNYKQYRSEADQSYHFVLKAANDETLGMSEPYASQEGMEVLIASVKRDGPIAPVVELI
jgi:hypothetical protein